MRTTVRLPPELARKAKKYAEQHGRTLTSLIEEGLLRVLSEAPKLDGMPRVRLPLSKARGGLQPGVDLDDSAALEDLMDGR